MACAAMQSPLAAAVFLRRSSPCSVAEAMAQATGLDVDETQMLDCEEGVVFNDELTAVFYNDLGVFVYLEFCVLLYYECAAIVYDECGSIEFYLRINATKYESILKYEVRIINILGDVVWEYHITNDKSQIKSNYEIPINLRQQPVGIYFIQMMADNGVTHQKIVITK